MANFDVENLVLSDPITHDFRGAERLAVGAEHLLQHVAIARDLPEAISRCVYAIGTSSRSVKGVLTPEAAVERLYAHLSRGPVALVLGGEKRGLSDEELACCHDAAAIPTSDLQPSMNVSHAAALFLFLFHRVKTGRAAVVADREEGANGRTLKALEEKLMLALDCVGWSNPQAPQHGIHELLRSLVKGRLTQREAQMWLSVMEHVRRTAQRATELKE
jgi:tRNA/rRNA methyltransferase